jgi:hypothetical protein
MDKDSAEALMRELKAPAEPMNRATALAMQLNDQKGQEAVPRSQMSCYLDRTNRVLPTIATGARLCWRLAAL